MVFIQTLAERIAYRGPLSEVLEQITNYQTTAFLPKAKARYNDKEGGSLERTIQTVKETEDGKFVIDGLVAEPFKPQYTTESDYLRSSTRALDEYPINQLNAPKLLFDEGTVSHPEIEERVRDAKYKSMGITSGTGKHFTPKQNDLWKILSKMGSYFALTTITYSFA